MKIRPVGIELFHADGQTGRHDEANSSFSQFFESAQGKLREMRFRKHHDLKICVKWRYNSTYSWPRQYAEATSSSICYNSPSSLLSYFPLNDLTIVNDNLSGLVDIVSSGLEGRSYISVQEHRKQSFPSLIETPHTHVSVQHHVPVALLNSFLTNCSYCENSWN